MAGYGKGDAQSMKARNMVGKEFFSEKKPPMGPPMSAKTGPAMYAKGGKVKHDDAKQDAAMVKKMVKPGALAPAAMAMKKGGKACYAQGGAAKVRRGVANPDGSVKKNAVPRGKMRGM